MPGGRGTSGTGTPLAPNQPAMLLKLSVKNTAYLKYVSTPTWFTTASVSTVRFHRTRSITSAAT